MIKKSTQHLKQYAYAFITTLSLNAVQYAQSSIPVITTQEETDLELFETTSAQGVPIFHLLDKTQTIIGRNTLKNILKNPLHTERELIARQNIIKQFTDQTLASAVTHELEIFKKHEYALYSLWQPQDPVQAAALEEFYFTMSALKKYNASPTLLSALQVLNVGNMFFPLIEHAVLHFLISDKVKETYHIGCSNHNHNHTNADSAFLAYNIYNTIHSGLHLWNAKGLYDHIKQKALVIKSMQESLISASRCIESMRRLYNISQQQEGFKKYLPHYTAIANIFDETRTLPAGDTSSQLIEILAANTFQGQSSVWSNIGNVLAAYHLMENAHALRDALAFTGEMDAHNAIAKLYTQHQAEPHHYTYALFKTSEKPEARFMNVWNPYLGNACCTHSMELGATMPNNSIITGDNAAGKSTLIKSMALTILLGQTLTIVPADIVSFTPFAKITTSIKHVDNIQAGTSLFITETLKAQTLLDTLENTLSETQFSFAIFDELFKSTNPEKGQKTAYKLISSLAKHPNSLALVATHYAQLTNLEEQNPALFRNYISQSRTNDQGKPIFELISGRMNN